LANSGHLVCFASASYRDMHRFAPSSCGQQVNGCCASHSAPATHDQHLFITEPLSAPVARHGYFSSTAHPVQAWANTESVAQLQWTSQAKAEASGAHRCQCTRKQTLGQNRYIQCRYKQDSAHLGEMLANVACQHPGSRLLNRYSITVQYVVASEYIMWLKICLGCSS
jgi:hypothetical protein